MKKMKMVYLFKDPYDEIVGAYQKPDDALKDLLEYNEEDYNFVDDEKRAKIFKEANERAYKEGDEGWYEAIYCGEDDGLFGVILQLPLN